MAGFRTVKNIDFLRLISQTHNQCSGSVIYLYGSGSGSDPSINKQKNEEKP